MTIQPMLAMPLDKVEIKNWGDWAIEEKFDGHRLMVVVESDGGDGVYVKAWTRPRKHAGGTGKTMAVRELPTHLQREFAMLPQGMYDGELLGGDTSTDVTRLDVQASLRFVVFDVVRLLGEDTTRKTYDERRALLETMFTHRLLRTLKHLTLAENCALARKEDALTFCEVVWRKGGEGAMLKRRAAPYQPGKRSRDVVKMKKLQTTVCTIVGFEATRGKVLSRGPFATVILEDEDGNRTSVKTKDDAELDAFNRAAANIEGTLDHVMRVHPAIGRRLRIEYQDWTPKGGYRHPRWDRWEDE